jgi:FkbM family methyltransferase
MEKTLKIFGKEITLTLRNEGDYSIAGELFLEHQYRFCDEVIKRAQDAIIDIGGHLGFFSLYAGLLNSKVPIFAFEPHEGNYALLKENLSQNHIKNVTPKQLAVSNAVGQSELHISAEDLNHSMKRAIEPTGQIQKVQTTTLARIFEKNRLAKADLIKIDCEGSEFDILYATPPEIFQKCPALFIEYHDWAGAGNHRELKSVLEKNGYKLEEYPNHKFKELGFMWCRR